MKKVILAILVAVLFSGLTSGLAMQSQKVSTKPSFAPVIEGCGFWVGTKYGLVWVSVGC
jgi:hypothetical protein